MWGATAPPIAAHRAAGGTVTLLDFRGRRHEVATLRSRHRRQSGARVTGAEADRARHRASPGRHRRKRLRQPHLVDGPGSCFCRADLPAPSDGQVVWAERQPRARLAFAETHLAMARAQPGPHEARISARGKHLPTGGVSFPMEASRSWLEVIGRPFRGRSSPVAMYSRARWIERRPIIHPP